ncbi:unnamed protein product [Cylindrotheca closterium]|uniref:TNase-like domain-containing protein n=1 Tax=Cylindrotheca closterium TaxID=2856 RepID=A0AAD2CYN3_9STRA|nr:unnamed protein product [Cylindrotheca closterium]
MKTLSIRIYGVDAPELQKRNAYPLSQPFAEEAKQLTSDLVIGRKKDVSIELTKRGLATLYTGGGAEYDGNRALLESLEGKAKKSRVGVWSNNNYVSPAEFKRMQ